MNQIRVNALCIFLFEGKVLVGKGTDPIKNQAFCRPFGGGIEARETSEQAVVREIKEELGATAINLKKLTVLENIFGYRGKKMHEITFLYKGDILEKHFYENQKFPRLDKDGFAEWIHVSDILSGKLILYPEKVRDYLVL
jgi:8-oxo-dGTP pyrophosphatase MutT (NUDIX family)